MPQPTEMDAIKRDLSDLRNELRESIGGLRADIKEIAKAFHELVRLDGDIGRVADVVSRLGKEMDDLSRRMRTLELDQAGNTKSVGLFDWIVRNALTVIISGAIGAAVVAKVT